MSKTTGTDRSAVAPDSPIFKSPTARALEYWRVQEATLLIGRVASFLILIFVHMAHEQRLISHLATVHYSCNEQSIG